MPPVRVAVVGVGHLGQHHARLYHNLPDAQLVAVCDIDAHRAREVARRTRCQSISDYRQLFEMGLDAVSVVTPTQTHADISLEFLAHGLHVLVEKPITQTVAQADRLIEEARARKRVLQVGHVERFNGAVSALSHLKSPCRFIEVHRLGPFKKRSTDIGVVLDLMIHDLDITLWLVDSPIQSIDAVGAPVLTDREDIANCRVRFENGCVANLTASRITDKSMRKFRIFGRDAYLVLDYLEESAQLYTKQNNEIRRQGFNLRREEPLRAELQNFLSTITASSGNAHVRSAEDSRAALDAALRITVQIRDQMAKEGVHVR